MPILIEQAKACLTGPFSLAEVGVLAESAVMAAQDLKGVFAGTERARIAQTVLVYAVQEVLPDSVESWVLPLLEGEGITRLIEATFRKLFGTEAVPAEGAAPVVDANDVAEGGVQ